MFRFLCYLVEERNISEINILWSILGPDFFTTYRKLFKVVSDHSLCRVVKSHFSKEIFSAKNAGKT